MVRRIKIVQLEQVFEPYRMLFMEMKERKKERKKEAVVISDSAK